jgi:hypothetical protein
MKTTEKIRELANKRNSHAEFIPLCCNNAARMAELLERAERLLRPYFTMEDSAGEWRRDFEKFQRGENA